MNIIDITGLIGIVLIVWGLWKQIRSLLHNIKVGSEKADLGAITGFAFVSIGWFLQLITMGAAVKSGAAELIYITAALTQAGSIALYLSGLIALVGLLLLAFRKSMGY